MKALKILKAKQKVLNSNLKDRINKSHNLQYEDDNQITNAIISELNFIDEAIKELEEYESDMDRYLGYTTNSRCSKSFNSCLSSIKSIYDITLEEIIKENSQDRLAELEKAILDYYLSIGYKIGEGGWSFKVNLSTAHKCKEIQIKFSKDYNSSFEEIFRTHSKTTKEIFDKAFKHFLAKGDNK